MQPDLFSKIGIPIQIFTDIRHFPLTSVIFWRNNVSSGIRTRAHAPIFGYKMTEVDLDVI